MTRLERQALALAVITTRPCIAMASTPCELVNPLNGRGLATSRGARMASNARRNKERAAGRTLAMRLEGGYGGVDSFAVLLTRISPKAFDDDNTTAALKSIRDGMAERWGIDDADERITWVTDWRKGPQHQVEAKLWVMPEGGNVAVLSMSVAALSAVAVKPMPSDVEVDASDWERPQRVVVHGGLIQRREVRVTPNVIRAKGGA